MRTHLLTNQHLPLFAKLSPEETRVVWCRLSERYPTSFGRVPAPGTPEILFRLCSDAGLDHANTVFSVADLPGESGRELLEKIAGVPVKCAVTPNFLDTNSPSKKITRKEKKTNGRRCYSNGTDDTRVVVGISPNPYRAGSQAWEDHNKWVVGKTVGEVAGSGITARGLRRAIRDRMVVLQG